MCISLPSLATNAKCGWNTVVLNLGEFDDVLLELEKHGGTQFYFNNQIQLIKFMIESGCVNLGSNGLYFTWCNNRQGEDRIYNRLVIANTNWISTYPKSTFWIYPDFLLITTHWTYIFMVPLSLFLKDLFPFLAAWLRDEDCDKVVNLGSSKKDHNVPIMKKLNDLSKDIRLWNKNHFGFIQRTN